MDISIPPDSDLSRTPLASNPSGAPPNFLDPPSEGPLIIGITVTLMAISLGFVSARAVHKIQLRNGVFAEDYFCFLAWILALTYSGLVLSMTKLSRHAWDTPLSFFSPSLEKRAAAIGYVYAPAAWLSKASIFATYIRLFGSKKWLRWSSYFGMGILVPANTILPIIGTYCILRNRQRWDLTLLMTCSVSEIPAIVQGAFNLAADVTLLVLPLPVTSSISLPKRKRWAISAVFLTGFFGIISSCLGLYYRVRTWNGSDLTWNAFTIYVCIIVELYITIIVSCAPAMAWFWRNTISDSSSFARYLQQTRLLLPGAATLQPFRIRSSANSKVNSRKGASARSKIKPRKEYSSTESGSGFNEGNGDPDDYDFRCVGLEGDMMKPYVTVHASTSHFREASEGGGIMKSVTVDQY